MATNWFLRNKKEKMKEKKKKSSDTSSSKDDSSSVDTQNSNNIIDLLMNAAMVDNSDKPMVDEEGYIIRPNLTSNDNNSDNHFYSSSDSEEEEERQQKISIKIKPLTNGAPISASIDDLIASAGTLSLWPITRQTSRRVYTSSTSPAPEDNNQIKRSISANHNLSKTENDLISVFSSSLSSASTPSGVVNQKPNNTTNSNCSFNSNTTINSNNCNKSPTVPPADRYAALSELFTESLSESTPVIPKSMSTSTILGPPLAPLPRPASKRNPNTSPQLSQQSSYSSTISRCRSASSLSSDFRMTPISIGSSRGPSPLTLGISDVIPIAIALQESVSACFKGTDESKCQVKVIGSLKMAFPPGIIKVFANNPYPSPLTFRLNKSSKLENIYPNKELLNDNDFLRNISCDSYNFEVNMTALLSHIRRLYEQSPNAKYYNIDVLKYQTRCLEGARSAPLQLVSYWKCEPKTTSLKVDYKYNGSSLTKLEALRNIGICVNVDGQPLSMKCTPEGNWNASLRQAMWRFDRLSLTTKMGPLDGLGSIKAKFDLASGPSTPSVIQAQFSCVDTTVSGIDFELTAIGYRISLVKKQITSGRYICEPSLVNT
ncbi:SH3-containing GRB2-like protein 3-interacting protein 1 isoform X2 [Oppia nitens]|uniref:SH3-containing GRB2-like protein 3-interacting protein 1 isoform X2 n=1 Tax=Oppia nitens TaxID=1686743 RepID=UPI0023DA01C4|nr:SH3-containing GRB2-like protein 3-interacting protein 1 isoform X2 [Oppia nitens]